MRTRFRAACLLLLVLASAAACSRSAGSTGVASVHRTAATSATSATTSRSMLEQGVRWARCMRQHGVPMGDPVATGRGGIHFPGSDKHALDQNVVDKAKQACQQYFPVLSGADLAAKLASARELALCMRAHGVQNYPDPDPNDLGKDLPDAVRDDPQYDQAKTICGTRRSS